jgi:hypothetical protein
VIWENKVKYKSHFPNSNLTNSGEQLNNHLELKTISELKMNKNQKYVLIAGVFLIATALIYWYTQGAEILTKTQILVDNTTDLDRMLGVENKQYVDKFILGLDYAGGFSAAIAVLSGILIYLFRKKQKES